MRFRGWPRTIRSQLLAALVVLEAFSLVVFGALLIRQQKGDIMIRAQQRLKHQAGSVAVQAAEALERGQPSLIEISVRMMGDAPSVDNAKVTDPNGKVLYSSQDPSKGTDPAALAHYPLTPLELTKIGKIPADGPVFLNLTPSDWDGAAAIRYEGKIYGYAWVTTDRTWDREQLVSTFYIVLYFGLCWIAASVALAWILALSITRPLAVLHRGTRALMQSPENHHQFPLHSSVHNEIGELIEAFNRMVASLEEQRSGLNDTLSLLDSMLANAPIGLAFFDRQCRFVRVNRIFAEATRVPLSRHLGRTLPEILASPVAQQLEETILNVFEHDEPVRDLEVTSPAEFAPRGWTWIASAYPVHTHPHQVRWVGLIVMDASDRKRSEEALRKTEKLAATGRLAASIAHEINNPLEAITNLLYLLSNQPELEPASRSFLEMAEHEVRRISEITQQTLRFYRQSTSPARAKLSELLDSVLSLHQGRLRNLGITIVRKYDSDTSLFCFAGELRQVFANLFGNAIDAMPAGGTIVVRARRSRDWTNPSRTGVRFLIADNGSGMTPDVQKRIFEAFFTTKEVTGTGLGLWVCSEIIAKHKGIVRVRSRSEAMQTESMSKALGGQSGTAFQLFFPDEEEPDPSPEAEQPVTAAGA